MSLENFLHLFALDCIFCFKVNQLYKLNISFLILISWCLFCLHVWIFFVNHFVSQCSFLYFVEVHCCPNHRSVLLLLGIVIPVLAGQEEAPLKVGCC